MQFRVDQFNRKELYTLLRFHIDCPAYHYCRIPEGVTVPAALSKLKVGAIRELIVRLRIPCTLDTMVFARTRAKDMERCVFRSYPRELENYQREAERLRIPPTPPQPPTELELANEELAKSKKKWEEKQKAVRTMTNECGSYCKKIGERRAMIEQMRRKIREYEDVVAGSQDHLKKMFDEHDVLKGMADHAWWEWTNAAEKVDKLDKTVETCSVCMDEKKSSQLFKTDCKHPLCTDCFTRMREYAAPGTMAAPRSVPCPICRAPIST